MATEPMTGLMRVSRPLPAAMPSIPERISYYYWVDGILLNTDLSTPITPGNANFASAQSTFIGDYGGGFTGNYSIDSIRLTSGAFAPVPEPAAALLGAFGLLGLLRRRR